MEGPIGTCLLTGASHGLGLALARDLAARGWHVLGTGRRPAGALPPDLPDIAYLQADLTDPAAVASVAD